MISICIFLAVLLILPILSAVEFDIKPAYSQGETMLAKISGNFVTPILKDNIFFYRQRTDGTGFLRIPINDFDLTIINDEYYIYAELPETPNNYKISLENVRYYKGSQIINDNIERNFTITNQTADFSIDKGFINTNNDFSFNLQNLQDKIIGIDIKIPSALKITNLNSNSLSLKSGEIKKIDFRINTDEINETYFYFIEFFSANLDYKIPVYLFTNTTLPASIRKELKFESPYLYAPMSTNSSSLKYIYLKNTGNIILENITLYLSDNLKNYSSLSALNIADLEPNSSIKLELYLYSDSHEKIIEGDIKAKTEDVHTFLDIFLNITSAYVPLPGENQTVIKKPCSLLGGTPCDETQTCSGEKKDSLEGNNCCIGTCETASSGSSTGKIFGWAIVIIVVIFLLWFFGKKYKGTHSSFNLLKTAEKGSRE